MGRFLEIRELSKTYDGVHALDRFRINLYPGEVHCLCGENGSGKTTLVKLLNGREMPEKGARIILKGEPLEALTIRRSLKAGIRVIFQDLGLFPHMTVGENLSLYPTPERSRGFYRPGRLKARTETLLEKYGINLPLNAPLDALNFAEKQLVAILRAVMAGPELLIFDEPTSGLPAQEVESVYRIIRDLKASGVGILFITHKLNEVYDLADRITVVRDGRFVGEFDPRKVDESELIYHISGRQIIDTPPARLSEADPVLEVEGLSGPLLEDVSFVLGRGEILGVAGRLGSGRTELAQLLFGIRKPRGGAAVSTGWTSPALSPGKTSPWGWGMFPRTGWKKDSFWATPWRITSSWRVSPT